MLEALKSLAERSVLERLVLLVDHVVGAEPAATDRLRGHVGRTLRVEVGGWPDLLPALPPLVFRVTPAGLIEWLDEPPASPADLRVTVEAANPARVLLELAAGRRPTIAVDGDARFATDVNWLIENLRWEIQDDLARVVGDAPARELARFGGAVAGAIGKAARTLTDLAARRGGSAAEPPTR